MNLHDPWSPVRWTALLVAMLCVLSACSMSSGNRRGPSSGGGVPSAPPHPLTYVALGDSFVSAPLVPVTDVANGCFRSSANYPSLVARELGAKLDDRSCGGAQTMHLDRSQFPDVPAQLSALNPDVDLVTIGIGGNDGRLFTRLTTRCPQLRAQDPTGAPCEAAMVARGRDMLLTTLEQTETQVTGALREVQQRAPDAKVLVVGYPEIITAGEACTRLPLARGDYAYAAKVNLALTEMLRRSAQTTGATYVDVFTASKGHSICSDDPWINGAISDTRRAAAYHPFAAEQAAVADLVVAAVRG
jgi:lysophospholipase L1-like esterase